MKASGLMAGVLAIMSVWACPATAADTAVIAKQNVATSAKAGYLVFPSGLYGTKGDALEQIDDIMARADAELKAAGLRGVADMMKHTIVLKEGAGSPVAVIGRLHAAIRRLAPGLGNNPSVGTIILVPSFPDPATLVMVDMAAGSAAPGQAITRYPMLLGPNLTVETVGSDQIVFTTGIEAMDFEYMTVKPTADEQLEAIAVKLEKAVRHAKLKMDQIVSYNLYVTKGNDPVRVAEKLNEILQRYAPGLKERPGVGTVVVVDGMAIPDFRMEFEAIAARGDPATFSRLPSSDAAKTAVPHSITAGGLAFVGSVGGLGSEAAGGSGADVASQARVSARNVASALQAGKLKPSDVVKFNVHVRQGDDAAAALASFHKALQEIDAGFDHRKVAETVIMVEGFPKAAARFEVTTVAAQR